MRLVAFFVILAGAAFGATIAHDPSPSEIDDIIAKFAAQETAFQQARDNYTYRQDASVMSLDDDGNVTGKWQEVSDIVFSPEGTRMDRVVHAPMSTLEAFQLDPGDIQDLRDVQPFVLTTSELPKYYIRYLGREKLDEIPCFAFAVKPKKLESGKRYFEGIVWVDDQGTRDRQELRPRRRHHEGRSSVPEVRNLSRTNRWQVFFPNLHHCQCHAALSGSRPAHEDGREISRLQAVQERHDHQVRRCGRSQ